jgi:hypothetical protein
MEIQERFNAVQRPQRLVCRLFRMYSCLSNVLHKKIMCGEYHRARVGHHTTRNLENVIHNNNKIYLFLISALACLGVAWALPTINILQKARHA